MDQDKLELLLKDIGLSEYESKIYLTLLSLGESTTSQILKKLGIHIGRIYEILNSLMQKGLVSEVQKNGVKYYTPAQPSKILDYLQKRKLVLEQQEATIQNALPQLQGLLSSIKQQPHIEIYVGYEGLKTAMQKEMSYYKKGKEVLILGVSSKNIYPKEVTNFFLNVVYASRKKCGVIVRKINDLSSKDQYSKYEPDTQVRYLIMNSTIATHIIGDLSILTVSYNPMMCIVIEDKNVADGFRSQFEHLWKTAKK